MSDKTGKTTVISEYYGNQKNNQPNRMMHMGTYVCTCHMYAHITLQFYVITFVLFLSYIQLYIAYKNEHRRSADPNLCKKLWR